MKRNPGTHTIVIVIEMRIALAQLISPLAPSTPPEKIREAVARAMPRAPTWSSFGNGGDRLPAARSEPRAFRRFQLELVDRVAALSTGRSRS